MDLSQLLSDADKLVDWADKMGEPNKPITFPHEARSIVRLEDGKYRGHPVNFLPAPVRKVYARQPG